MRRLLPIIQPFGPAGVVGPETSAGGSAGRKPTAVMVFARWVVASVFGVAVLPVAYYAVSIGLDPSWGLGLHMASNSDLAFGRDIAWTFGPLGFLAAPVMAFPTTGLLAHAIRVPFAIGAAYWCLERFRSPAATRRNPVSLVRVALSTAAAYLATWVLVGPLAGGGGIVNAAFAIFAAWGCHRALTRQTVTTRGLIVAACASGFLALVKFDAGFVGAAITSLLALDQAVDVNFSVRERLRRLAITLGTTIGTVVVLWVLAGQPISTLGAYVANSIELGRGYGAGMAARFTLPWFTKALAATALVAAAVVVRSRQLRRPTIYGVLLVGGSVATVFQQSFGRYDSGHAQRFVLFCVALIAAFVSTRNKPLAIGAIAFATLVASSLNDVNQPFPSFGWPKGQVGFAHPDHGFDFVRDLAHFTTSAAARNERIKREHDRLGILLAVPKPIRDVARNRTVHVGSFETSAAWVYGWKWKPLPVFQSYQANTPALDRLGVDAINDDVRAPEVIVSQSVSIDNRVERWTPPETQLAMLCRYRPELSDSGFTAWTRRNANVCGEISSPKTVRVGELNAIVQDNPDRVVVVRFQRRTNLASSLTDRPLNVEVNGAVRTMTAALVGGPNIVSLPRCLVDAVGTSGGFDVRVLLPTTMPSGITRLTVETIDYRC